MGASSGVGSGEGASVVYNKKIGGPMKIAPSRPKSKIPAVNIIGSVADKVNLKRRKAFIKKEGIDMSSMDDAYIVSPTGKAEINRLTGGKYDRYNRGELSGNVGNQDSGGDNRSNTQKTALLSTEAANTETQSDEVITETANQVAKKPELTEAQKIIKAKRANKVKTRFAQKDDELTLDKKVLLSV